MKQNEELTKLLREMIERNEEKLRLECRELVSRTLCPPSLFVHSRCGTPQCCGGCKPKEK